MCVTELVLGSGQMRLYSAQTLSDALTGACIIKLTQEFEGLDTICFLEG